MGVPLPELAEAWKRSLDAIEPAPGLLAHARARLARGSLFARRCAREVAGLEVRAAWAAAAGRTAEACALLETAAARSGDPRTLAAEGDVRARAGDLDGAARAYREAAVRVGDSDGALWATIVAARGDLAWRRDELGEAVSAWSAALATHPERGDARLLEAKIAAVSDPDLGPAARAYLLGEGDPAVALARVARERHPLAAYLVGRAVAIRGEAAAAIPDLERAERGRLPPELAREARLLLGEARCAAGEAEAGAETLRASAEDSAGAADRARAAEALRRCEWHREAR